MRVLMINSVCGIGSTGRICTDLAEILHQQGHEVRIAYARGEVQKSFSEYAVRIGTNFDVVVHGIKSQICDAHGFGSVRVTKKFINWIESYNPDVIHLHNIHGYYINNKLLFDYLKVCGKRIIWTLHDCWSFTGHCSHFDYVGCEKWVENCYSCPQYREYPRSLLFDRSRRNYRRKRALFCGVPNMTVVTPSKWLAEVVGKSFLNEYPVQPIYNGIDLNCFRPTESDFCKVHGVEDKKIILGVSSVWNERKGLNDFIELSKIIDDAYIIVLLGLSRKQIKQLPKNIIGIQKTNDKKSLCEIYTAADVFVNPSKEETMGLTTVEALACGTPAIVYNKTAVPEVVDSLSGIILNENTPKAIADNLSNLNFTVENCLNRARFFDKQNKYREYIELYQMKSND